MMDNENYKHTLRLRTMYCFFTAGWLGKRASVLSYLCIASLVPPPTRFSKSMESLPISVVFPLEQGAGEAPENEGFEESVGWIGDQRNWLNHMALDLNPRPSLILL